MGSQSVSQLSSPAMSDPLLACVAFVVANDTAAHGLLPVLQAVGDAFPVRLYVMDRVRGEGAGKIFDRSGLSYFDLSTEPIHGPGMSRLARLRSARSLHARIVSEFRRVRPSLIALTCDLSPLDNLTLAAAAALNIPSVLIQDGVLSLNPRRVGLLRHIKSFVIERVRRMGIPNATVVSADYGGNGANYHIVQGPAFKKRLVAMGVPESHVWIGGQPRYDDLMERVGAREFDPRRRPQRVLVALCGSVAYGLVSHAYYYGSLGRLAALLYERRENYCATYKPHPRCRYDDFEETLGPYLGAETRLARPDDPITSLLRDCDILITDRSTVALEALIVGRLVIALNPFFPSPEPSIYETAGCVLALDRIEDLGTALESLLANEASARKIRESAALAIDEWLSHLGAAGKRVAEIIAFLREQSVSRASVRRRR